MLIYEAFECVHNPTGIYSTTHKLVIIPRNHTSLLLKGDETLDENRLPSPGPSYYFLLRTCSPCRPLTCGVTCACQSRSEISSEACSCSRMLVNEKIPAARVRSKGAQPGRLGSSRRPNPPKIRNRCTSANENEINDLWEHQTNDSCLHKLLSHKVADVVYVGVERVTA